MELLSQLSELEMCISICHLQVTSPGSALQSHKSSISLGSRLLLRSCAKPSLYWLYWAMKHIQIWKAPETYSKVNVFKNQVLCTHGLRTWDKSLPDMRGRWIRENMHVPTKQPNLIYLAIRTPTARHAFFPLCRVKADQQVICRVQTDQQILSSWSEQRDLVAAQSIDIYDMIVMFHCSSTINLRAAFIEGHPCVIIDNYHWEAF